MEQQYFYLSLSPDGWQNLALDEWLLDRIGEGQLVLYLYINQNAVVIGKNQNPWKECNLAAMEQDKVQLVRRVTGGGAVFHDSGNLNFSFIAGKGRYDLQRQMGLILSALRAMGIPAEFDSPRFLEAIKRIIRAVKAAGKFGIIYVDDETTADQRYALGYNSVTIQLDSTVYFRALNKMADEVRKAVRL